MSDVELGDDECVECKQTCLEEYYKCDSCLKRIHKKCANITPSEVKCMPLQKRVLLLICRECRLFVARMPCMMKLMEEMKRDIEEIKSEMKSSLKKESYATILQNNQNNKVDIRTSLPAIVIKPKIAQNSQKSKQDIQTSINPAKLSLGIRNVKETKQGNRVVKCETKQDIERFKEEAERKLNGKYDIELLNKNSPKIKIAGYTGEESVENLEVKIRKQNKWIDTFDHLKITYIRRPKNKQNSTIYAECSGSLFCKMLNYGKVYIDWERLPVYEDLSVSRCYKCQGFFHKSTKCEKNEVCGNCAGNHSTFGCEWPKRCINCKVANEKYNLRLDTDHTALDPECPSLKHHINLLKNKTDYTRIS